MKMKYFKLTLALILGLFLMTGCVGKNEVTEQEKADSKLETILKADQISEKEITFTVQNGKKGTSEKGILILDEGEDITEDYSFHGMKQGDLYLIPKGKTKEEALMYDFISGEGNSTAMDISAGEYEVLFEVTEDALTGTITVKAVEPEVLAEE